MIFSCRIVLIWMWISEKLHGEFSCVIRLVEGEEVMSLSIDMVLCSGTRCSACWGGSYSAAMTPYSASPTMAKASELNEEEFCLEVRQSFFPSVVSRSE